MDSVERRSLSLGEPHQSGGPHDEPSLLEVGDDGAGLAGFDRVGLHNAECQCCCHDVS
jgi:hypothetical protein